MELGISFLIAIAVLVLVTLPLFGKRKKKSNFFSDELDTFANLTFQKETVLSNLMDVEMDFKMGKLNEDDYERLKSNLTFEASFILEKLELLDQSVDFETHIENEIKSHRRMNGHVSTIPKEETETLDCPICSAQNDLANKFCNSCGHSFEVAEKICSECSAANPIESNFCGNCGGNLNKS